MDLSEGAITIVIKAPNQRLEDQTVECMLGWTVRKLKRHLESVYPSKPKETQQKLIYSGKLLPDDATLKDVLRQSQDCPSQHTVHLVCSSGLDFIPTLPNSRDSKKQPKTETSSSPSTPSVTNISSGISDSSSVRYRGQVSPDTNTQAVPEGSSRVTQPSSVEMPPIVMPPGYEAFYTQEQYTMMVQNYYYQMAAAQAQYMQYYQNGMYPTPPNTPATPQEEPDNRNEPNIQAPANVGAANANNLVMNAQGGMVVDDDDDDFGQRDWLDYVHTFARFVVLISIVYFYSNFSRFLVVFAFFFLIYLYQTGWFQLARRLPENQQEANAQQEQPPAEHQQQAQEQPQEQQQVNTDTDEVPNTENTQEGETSPAEQPPPQRESVLTLIWCFISTFFTSLIPQPPPAVNAN